MPALTAVFGFGAVQNTNRDFDLAADQVIPGFLHRARLSNYFRAGLDSLIAVDRTIGTHCSCVASL